MAHPRFACLVVFALAVGWPVPVHAGDPDRIQEAVAQAVARLKEAQAADGSWPTHHVGATALVGLALLECDVPVADAAIQQAANHLREVWTSIEDKATYAIALTILFLDRLGEPSDVPIIQALAVRLLAGQNTEGGWDYACPPLTLDDVRQLQSLRKRQIDLKASEALPVSKAGGTRPALPKEVQQILARLKKGVAPMPPLNAGGDNSNTQFAVLALWVARRHGVPADQALARTASRFRRSQHTDGGWGYLVSGNRHGYGLTTASMTCAGLLGLALDYGSAREAVLRAGTSPRAATTPARAATPPAKDHAVRSALAALSRTIGQPLDPHGSNSPNKLGDMYYLLWSIERVAVAYDLPTIGKKDWYAWGSRLLLSAQLADGSWQGRMGADVDTSLAILFLRRANLAKDLTAYMKGGSGMQTELKAGPNELAGILPSEDAETAPAPVVEKPPAETKNSPVVKAPAPAAPPAAKDTTAEPARLSEAFLRASGPQREQLLDQLRQGKGAAYTDALASTIGRLQGEAKTKARDALAVRLARMTPGTLRDKLQDEEPEIRRAAALACAMKEDKQFVPGLIAMLKDRKPIVVRAAHAALKALTGKDFGPSDNSDEAAKRAAAAWDEWWKQHGK